MTDQFPFKDKTLEAPVFRLLYVGSDNRMEKTLPKIRKKCDLEIHSVSSLNKAVEEYPLIRVGKRRSCCFILLDMESLGLDVEGLKQAIDQKWSGNVVFLGLIGKTLPELSFLQWTELVAHDVLHFISKDEITATLEQFTSKPKGHVQFPNFALPFQKRPSLWLRKIRHDYANLLMGSMPDLVKAGLGKEQTELDLIQNILRNILAFPLENSSSRLLTQEDDNNECQLFHELVDRDALFLTPGSIDNLPKKWKPDGQYKLYENLDELERLIHQAGEDKTPIVISKTQDLDDILDRFKNHKPHLPIILVDEQIPSFKEKKWRKLLRSGVIGAYGLNQLQSENTHVFSNKRAYWKACGLMSFEGMFDRLLFLLEKTHEALDPDSGGRQRIVNVWCMVRNAKALYLGI